MNKEELIALKNKLMQRKRYGEWFPLDLIEKETLENLLTIDEIISNTKTKEAIEYIENYLEKTIEYLCNRGIDFDGIKILTMINAYISEPYMTRAVDCYDDRVKNPLKSDDFLEDYVTVEFNFSGYKLVENKEKSIDTIFSSFDREYQKNSKKFTVKYSEFIIMLNQLGYSVDSNSFSDIKSQMLSYKDNPDITIKVDLTSQMKHTL